MLYIMCLIFGFFTGWKFSKVWNLLQISVFKKQLDIHELEDKLSQKYKKEITFYKNELFKLKELNNFKEYEKEDFEEV